MKRKPSKPQPSTPEVAKTEPIAMEVHHHPHVEKKNFKEYLLEGLMIFIAVSLGFFAENIREKFVEHERAHELAETLYQEVFDDSVQLRKVINNRERKEQEIGYFINYVRDSSLNMVNTRFYRSFTWSFTIVSPILFEPADGMLTQLRNSGSLRYFKSNELQKTLGDMSVAIAKIKNRSEIEGSYVEQFIRPLVIKHYNFGWYDELTRQGTISIVDAVIQEPEIKEAPAIVNATTVNKIEMENTAAYYRLILRGTRQVQLKAYSEINHRLLQLLRKEYNVGRKE